MTGEEKARREQRGRRPRFSGCQLHGPGCRRRRVWMFINTRKGVGLRAQTAPWGNGRARAGDGPFPAGREMHPREMHPASNSLLRDDGAGRVLPQMGSQGAADARDGRGGSRHAGPAPRAPRSVPAPAASALVPMATRRRARVAGGARDRVFGVAAAAGSLLLPLLAFVVHAGSGPLHQPPS